MPYPATKKDKRVARRVAGVSADGIASLPGSIFCHYHGHSDIPQLRESRRLQVVFDDVGLHTGERADPVRRAGFEFLGGDPSPLSHALIPVVKQISQTPTKHRSTFIWATVAQAVRIDAATHHRMHEAPNENHLQV
jgi:hypothetical protein